MYVQGKPCLDGRDPVDRKSERYGRSILGYSTYAQPCVYHGYFNTRTVPMFRISLRFPPKDSTFKRVVVLSIPHPNAAWRGWRTQPSKAEQRTFPDGAMSNFSRVTTHRLLLG